jgi:hypothetical protein
MASFQVVGSAEVVEVAAASKAYVWKGGKRGVLRVLRSRRGVLGRGL